MAAFTNESVPLKDSEIVFKEVNTVDEKCFDEVSLTYAPIDEKALFEAVRMPSAGAISSFYGTTRDNFEGKSVTHLEYEAYPEMALKCMGDLCQQVRKKWNVLRIIMQHKLGPCPISEISIAILVSSEHRIDSIEAMHFLIDELKRTVPIWKKECYDDGNKLWKENLEQPIPVDIVDK